MTWASAFAFQAGSSSFILHAVCNAEDFNRALSLSDGIMSANDGDGKCTKLGGGRMVLASVHSVLLALRLRRPPVQ